MASVGWGIPITAAIVMAGVAGCTSHHAKQPQTPQAICRAHFAEVMDAQENTVRGVTDVGPVIPARRDHLGRYTGSTPVTLCLVGKPTDEFDSAIAITPDGRTYTVWKQGGSSHLSPPS